MKNRIIGTFIIFLFTAAFIACSNDSGEMPGKVVHNPITASGESDMKQLPVIEFHENVHDFGTVIEGETVIYSFKFRNTGNTDLVIGNVSASCGCTASKYTKEAVPPGEEGILTVTFDTRRRRGFQNKTLTVAANTQPTNTVLRIKAKIVSPGEL
jgi:hypothetical protein